MRFVALTEDDQKRFHRYSQAFCTLLILLLIHPRRPFSSVHPEEYYLVFADFLMYVTLPGCHFLRKLGFKIRLPISSAATTFSSCCSQHCEWFVEVTDQHFLGCSLQPPTTTAESNDYFGRICSRVPMSHRIHRRIRTGNCAKSNRVLTGICEQW